MTTITVNNRLITVDAEPDTPLLWVLRDHLGMTGTKFGCGMALCGACTVHVDGAATRSCVLPSSAVAGKSITTIEGLSPTAATPCRRPGSRSTCRSADIASRDRSCPPPRCSKPIQSPTDADIDAAMSGNICRCGTYPRIRKAIHRAAELLASEHREVRPAPALSRRDFSECDGHRRRRPGHRTDASRTRRQIELRSAWVARRSTRRRGRRRPVGQPIERLAENRPRQFHHHTGRSLGDGPRCLHGTAHAAGRGTGYRFRRDSHRGRAGGRCLHQSRQRRTDHGHQQQRAGMHGTSCAWRARPRAPC